MKKAWFAASCAVSLAFAPISVIAQDATLAEAALTEERLLGAAGDEARYLAVLPFTRAFTVSGTVAGSLEASAIAAGIDAAILIGARQALAAAIDGQDIRDGDRFFIRYTMTFTAEGAAIGVGRVQWLELTTAARGTVAFHRFQTPGFQTSSKGERFWLVNGQEASLPAMSYPLSTVAISSGFGPRSDPFRARNGTSATVNPVGGPTPSAGLSPALGSDAAGSSAMPYASMALGPVRRPAAAYLMHTGVDLVAPASTPVRAAADGIVIGAAPNGAYGNWIRIDHARDLATVYGHLSQFAPGLHPGMSVARGDVIGFVGSTGHSTGPHLHFELLRAGKPVNPMNTPEFKPATLYGPELDRFRKLVARAQDERAREDGVPIVAF